MATITTQTAAKIVGVIIAIFGAYQGNVPVGIVGLSLVFAGSA